MAEKTEPEGVWNVEAAWRGNGVVFLGYNIVTRTRKNRGSQMTPKVGSIKNKKKGLGKVGGHKWPLRLKVSKIRKKDWEK